VVQGETFIGLGLLNSLGLEEQGDEDVDVKNSHVRRRVLHYYGRVQKHVPGTSYMYVKVLVRGEPLSSLGFSLVSKSEETKMFTYGLFASSTSPVRVDNLGRSTCHAISGQGD